MIKFIQMKNILIYHLKIFKKNLVVLSNFTTNKVKIKSIEIKLMTNQSLLRISITLCIKSSIVTRLELSIRYLLKSMPKNLNFSVFK
jgi:hypothetical protein